MNKSKAKSYSDKRGYIVAASGNEYPPRPISAKRKILIGIIGCDCATYNPLEVACRDTWLREVPEGMQALFYYGSNPVQGRAGDRVYFPFDENLHNIGRKTVAFFEFALEFLDFDYLFRANLSSYVHLPDLRDVVSQAPPICYQGVIGKENGIKFASGSGYLISKPVMEMVVEHQDRWNHDLIDDVALGDLLASLDLRPQPARRHDVGNLLELKADHFHYRMPCYDERERVPALMRHIHQLKTAQT